MFESGREWHSRLERNQGIVLFMSRMQGLDDFLSDWKEAEGLFMAENKEKKGPEKTVTVRQGTPGFLIFFVLLTPVYSSIELVSVPLLTKMLMEKRHLKNA
jgi:hypothetical protein